MTTNFIFILHNIYESVNGVSNKYIKFINYLINENHQVTLYTTFKDKTIYNNILNINNFTNFKLIKVNGLNVPFYKDIKIPTIKYSTFIKNITNKDIIIFNGEFIWLYDILKKVKYNYPDIKLYPNMHTDYDYYIKNIYTKFNFISNLNHLNNYLSQNIFSGIIVTGNKMVNKYTDITHNVFNANEVNLQLFKQYKMDDYNLNNSINVIYCGRISKEKNIDELFECFSKLVDNFNNIHFKFHIIGNGPYIDNILNIIDILYINIKDQIIFHGELSGEFIYKLYHELDNRIFLFASLSETFGKTPIEASASGIPVFIKKSDITNDIYINRKNAFIFNNKNDLINEFQYFIDLNIFDKKIFIKNSVENTKKYDQSVIFNKWMLFLMNINSTNKTPINFFDIITLFSIGKLVNCSGNFMDN